MKVSQSKWSADAGWQPALPNKVDSAVQWVLVFASTELIQKKELLAELRKCYPAAHFFGCSTAGEIISTHVSDDTLVASAIQLEHTSVRVQSMLITSTEESFEIGQKLAESLPKAELTHVFVLSDGLHINGSDLVRGLSKNLPSHVAVTGGLSGDGARFEKTFVLTGDSVESNRVGVVGFYGSRMRIGYASLGGWDPFGPERVITRSSGNILYELDGKSALQLYKTYLGEHAEGLPATGLLFPLSLRMGEGDSAVVRTILSVNEKDESMVFAGNVPEGSFARFMKANFDRLIDGAEGAAKVNFNAIGSVSPSLAVLISCVGRKLILKQRVEEEIEGARDVLGPSAALTGFYSYGEISPFTPGAKCELHNQTMTITSFLEI